MRSGCFANFLFYFVVFASVSAFEPQTKASLAVHRSSNKPLFEVSSKPHQENYEAIITRRHAVFQTLGVVSASILLFERPQPSVAATPRLDVNNALAREYTAFPGLFPTIATKIVKNGPYKNKKEVYAVLNEMEQERLKQYDSSIIISKPDAKLKQFKTSQICKYECGSRVSNEYRDEQIRQIQKERR